MRSIASRIAIVILAPILVPAALAMVPIGFWLPAFLLAFLGAVLGIQRLHRQADLAEVEAYANASANEKRSLGDA